MPERTRLRSVFRSGRPAPAQAGAAPEASLRRVVLTADSAAGLNVARRASEIWRQGAGPGAEMLTGLPALLSRIAAERPALVVYALEASPAPLGLLTTARQLTTSSAWPTLILRAGGSWPPRRILFPVSSGEIRAGTLRPAHSLLSRLLGEPVGGKGPSLTVLHVPLDAAEWDDGRERLQEQISLLGAPRWIEVRSCMRFGAPRVRRTAQAVTAEGADLLVLAHPAPDIGDRPGDAQRWLQIAAETRGSLLVLPSAGHEQPPPPAHRAALPWLERLGRAAL